MRTIRDLKPGAIVNNDAEFADRVDADDETMLLRIRQFGYFSPNAQSEGRATTIGILVRTFRHALVE